MTDKKLRPTVSAAISAARNETEDKKNRYLGNIFANVAFRPDVPKESARFCIKVAESLSYQQFCLISLIEKSGIFDAAPLRARDHDNADLEF